MRSFPQFFLALFWRISANGEIGRAFSRTSGWKSAVPVPEKNRFHPRGIKFPCKLKIPCQALWFGFCFFPQSLVRVGLAVVEPLSPPPLPCCSFSPVGVSFSLVAISYRAQLGRLGGSRSGLGSSNKIPVPQLSLSLLKPCKALPGEKDHVVKAHEEARPHHLRPDSTSCPCI